MRTMMTIVALTAIGAVILAAPGGALAGEWKLDNGAGKMFNVAGGASALKAKGGMTVKCNALAGNGQYANETTGNIHATFMGCKDSIFGAACTTPGQPAGSITVVNKQFHNVIIGDAGDKFTPIGILVTGGVGNFTTFVCLGINFVIKGDVIGEIEAPNCELEGKNYKLNFESLAHGVQKYRQVTTGGEMFDLISEMGGGETASLDSTSEVMFAQNVKPTCV